MTETTPPEYEIDYDTVVFKRSHLYAALIPLAFVLGLSLGFLFWGRSGGSSNVAVAANTTVSEESSENSVGTSQNEGAPAAQESVSNAGEAVNAEGSGSQGGAASGTDASSGETAPQEEVRRYEIPLDDDPQIGPEDAPITIVEFSDYECPYCRKFHIEVFSRLLEAYPDQVRFVYRDFPLASIHSNAISAAEASGCAFEQDFYWEFHDRLFSMERGLDREAYINYASDLGLDVDAFQECIDSRQYQAEVQADYDFAAQLGIRSTPTFFVNGLAVVGAQPFEVFQQVIERELAGEIP